jgi:uncharacterized BrkB/YihY/UPF0761 family membrane protein
VADAHDPLEPATIELEVEPTAAGRIARWSQRAHILRDRVEAARADHRSIELGFGLVERDSAIGGGLLAGALAYRLFVLLLPTALLLVTGLGLYSGAVDESPGKIAREAGLHGLIASQVSATASGRARGLIFALMIPAVLYAGYTLFRAISKVYAIAWLRSGRGVRVTPKGFAVFLGMLVVHAAAVFTLGWIRHNNGRTGLLGLLVYVLVVSASWFVVSFYLPRRPVQCWALLPGSLLFGVGLFLVNVFNVYVTTHIVEGRANTYGALGVATALLFSLVLVGRVIVVSAELNAALADRRAGRSAVDDAAPGIAD